MPLPFSFTVVHRTITTAAEDHLHHANVLHLQDLRHLELNHTTTSINNNHPIILLPNEISAPPPSPRAPLQAPPADPVSKPRRKK